MSPTGKGTLGQILKTLGIVFAGLGVFLTALAPTIGPGGIHDLIFGLAIVCVALGGIIAHQGGVSA